MITLVPYSASYETVTLCRVCAFLACPVTADVSATLSLWQTKPNALFILLSDGQSVGFVRLNHTNPATARVEAFFIDPAYRAQATASSAWAAVEERLCHISGCAEICVTVPRNEHRQFYQGLGYTDLDGEIMHKALAY